MGLCLRLAASVSLCGQTLQTSQPAPRRSWKQALLCRSQTSYSVISAAVAKLNKSSFVDSLHFSWSTQRQFGQVQLQEEDGVSNAVDIIAAHLENASAPRQGTLGHERPPHANNICQAVQAHPSPQGSLMGHPSATASQEVAHDEVRSTGTSVMWLTLYDSSQLGSH